MEEDVRSVEVDKRGFTALGKDLDQIIARISVDFAEPTKAQNLLHKVAAKGGRALHTYLMTRLLPECTFFFQANWMNVTRGCAHRAAAAVCHTKVLLDKGIIDKGIIHTKVLLNKCIVRN